jgi:Ca2+-binding EF-hand superfamily protein
MIVRDIKKIDKDNNGYVLINELNKIFKTHYHKEFDGKSLNKVLRPFSSI